MIRSRARIRWVITGLAATFLVAPTAAQVPGADVAVSGLVWDSLSGGPLAGATVRSSDGAARTSTDPQGRFVLHLRPGMHELEFDHRSVPSWSALRHATVVKVERGRSAEAVLATASEATVLARTCGGSGSVVGGVVRDMLTRVPLARALVSVSAEVGGGEERLGDIPTSMAGDFVLCLGALPEGALRVEATMGGKASRTLTPSTAGRRVVGAELNVLISEPARVSGRLVDGTTARPVAGALVRVEGSRLAARSSQEGAFLIRGVPPGAVALTVEHVRYGRRTTEVLVESGDSVHVEFELLDQAIPLEEMVVRVSGRDLDRRMRGGTRYDGLDEEEIRELLDRSRSFEELMRNALIPGVSIESSGRALCIELARRTGGLSPTRCQMAEVYLNDVRVADAGALLETLSPEVITSIRIVSPLDAVGRYGGLATKNGVLLLYTHGNGRR